MRYGGRVSDYISLGCEVFVKAYNSWDPAKSKFSTWLYWWLRNNLWDAGKKQARERSNQDPDMFVPSPSFMHRITELSEDAATVVNIVLTAPIEVLHQKGPRKYRKDKLIKLLRGMGWTVDRITESFAEIKDVLWPPSSRREKLESDGGS
jgi:hypothetical protein